MRSCQNRNIKHFIPIVVIGHYYYYYEVVRGIKKFVKIIKTFTMKIALLGWDGAFLSSVLFTNNFSFIKNS